MKPYKLGSHIKQDARFTQDELDTLKRIIDKFRENDLLRNDFDIYQQEADETAIYPNSDNTDGIQYVALGLAGESGEVAEKVKKLYRDDNGDLTEERAVQILEELGDVLWYVARLAHHCGYDLRMVAEVNTDKLRSRAERGKLQGDGDNR